MQNTSFRTAIIPTSYNGAVYGAGLPIYSVPSSSRSNDSQCLVEPGQPVFYNPDTGLSTGEAATKSTVANLKIGVGAETADGFRYIRWANDGFSGCSMQNLQGRNPACGLVNIKDLWIGCGIKCGQTYTFAVTAYDPITFAFGEKGIGYTYHFSYTLPCQDCSAGDCVEVEPNADEVICGLYNKIMGIENDSNWDITVNNFPVGVNHEYQFDVAMLFDGESASHADKTTFEFCLTGSDTSCESCNQFTAIGGYSLDGDVDVVFSPATFTGTASSDAQIKSAVAQLNAALGGNGSARYLPAVGSCCTNNKIEVNTCLLNFELHDHEGNPITPCSESNPFTDSTVYAECQHCTSSNGTRVFNRGLRFFSKPVLPKIDPIPGNHTLVEYLSEIDVKVMRGFEDVVVKISERQRATLPKGQGFQWAAREIQELREGFTNPYVHDNWGGKYGYPEPNDLLRQGLVDQKDAYCVIGGRYVGKGYVENTGESKGVPMDIYFLIKSDHTAMKTSVLNALNNYFAGGDCGLPTVTCSNY